MQYDDVNISSIEISTYDFEGYDKEYYVTLDADMNVYVEAAYVWDSRIGGQSYLGFVADVLYIDGEANSKIVTGNGIEECYQLDLTDKNNDEVIDFIIRRFPNDSAWLNGNCYYFSRILKDRFPDGEIFYDVIYGHFIFKYNDNYYDYSGVNLQNDGYRVPWDSFDNYDSIQKKRIIRDCIL